jgi:hypothetical protein
MNETRKVHFKKPHLQFIITLTVLKHFSMLLIPSRKLTLIPMLAQSMQHTMPPSRVSYGRNVEGSFVKNKIPKGQCLPKEQSTEQWQSVIQWDQC